MHDILSNSLPNFMHFENLGSYGSQLAIVLGIALFFGTLGGHFFQKLHVPQVVGYFIIGIIIGNSGLQLVQPEVIKTLNPIKPNISTTVPIISPIVDKISLIVNSADLIPSIVLFK